VSSSPLDAPAPEDVLTDFGARDSHIEEVLDYVETGFDVSGVVSAGNSTADEAAITGGALLPDEPHVSDWERYVRRAENEGTARVLRDVLVQLQFPIQEGMRDNAAYRRATLNLQSVSDWNPDASSDALPLDDPDGLTVTLHPTPAGRLPVITTGTRTDFERMLQALTRRNEPEPIRPSVGAMMVAGYRNWDRIARLKESWAHDHPDGTAQEWSVAFRQMDASAYSDPFVLCSSGPYSGVSGEVFGLDDEAWSQASAKVRIAHEATHYSTWRLFGSMRNALYDELMADYFGLVHAFGAFNAERFLTLMTGRYDGKRVADGRIEQYRGGLSDDAFAVVRDVLVAAAENVDAFDRWAAQHRPSDALRTQTLLAFARHSLVDLAAPSGDARLKETVQNASNVFER